MRTFGIALAFTFLLLVGVLGSVSALDVEEKAQIKANVNADLGEKGGRANLKAVSATDLEANEDVNSSDIQEANTDINSDSNASLRATSLAHVFNGLGWATSNNTGYFVRVLWVTKTFTDTNSSQDTTQGRGNIKLDTMPAYTIVLDSSTNDSLSFTVKGKNNESDGTLVLNRVSSFANMDIWQGTLTVGSNSYSLNFASKENLLKPTAAEDLANIKNEVKAEIKTDLKGQNITARIGFWERLSNFLKRNK